MARRRRPNPDDDLPAGHDRSPTQIAELQCCAWCQLLAAHDRPLALVLLRKTLGRPRWCRILAALVVRIGPHEAHIRLGPEARKWRESCGGGATL